MSLCRCVVVLVVVDVVADVSIVTMPENNLFCTAGSAESERRAKHQ